MGTLGRTDEVGEVERRKRLKTLTNDMTKLYWTQDRKKRQEEINFHIKKLRHCQRHSR